MSEREIYLQFQRLGGQLKVIAIDSKTGIEVSTFGPASVPQSDLGQLAIRKLKMRLARLEAEGK